MFEGLLEPVHLIVGLCIAVPVFMIGRVIWRVGSKTR